MINQTNYLLKDLMIQHVHQEILSLIYKIFDYIYVVSYFLIFNLGSGEIYSLIILLILKN